MKWWQILEAVGPLILQFTPLAPIAPMVIAGIKGVEALKIPGAQKNQIVQGIVQLGAQAVDAQTGKPLIDPDVAAHAAADVISSVVDITNAVHAAHAASGGPAVVPPAAPPAP